MSNQDMISAILSSIQNDANVFILIRALITNNLPIVNKQQLQAMMTALGLPYE